MKKDYLVYKSDKKKGADKKPPYFSPEHRAKISKKAIERWVKHHDKMYKATNHFRLNYPSKEEMCPKCKESRIGFRTRGLCTRCFEGNFIVI